MLISSHKSTRNTDAFSNTFTSKSCCCRNPEALTALIGLLWDPHPHSLPRATFKLSLGQSFRSWVVLHVYLSQALSTGWTSDFYCICVSSPISYCSYLDSGETLDLVHHFAVSRAEGCGFQGLSLPSMLRCCRIVPWSVRALPGLGTLLTPCSPSLRSSLSSLTIMKLQIKSWSHSDGNVPYELGHKPDGSFKG